MERGNNNYQALIVAVASICSSLEKFCTAVYIVLHELGDENEVIKEQLMETMQHSLHCAIQLQLVACARGLQFSPLNTELTMLTCLRSLLISVAMTVDAVDYMKLNSLIQESNSDNQVPLEQTDIKEAIVYILHYGRPLFKGDDGTSVDLMSFTSRK